MLLLLSSVTFNNAQAQERVIQHDAYSYKIINQFPHNTEFFTQGLVFHNNYLYESTGLRGHSKVMQVELATGKAISTHKLSDKHFGEGLTLLNGQLYHLTYQAKTGFIYDLKTLKPKQTFSYKTEGWGLTHNAKQLIMSDGSDKLYFLDKKTFKVQRVIEVFSWQGAVKDLNELEYIDGLIWANIWYSSNIVVIDPRSGRVVSTIDLSDLSPTKDYDDVLNGIAYDKDNKRLFVTGKRWPALFEIKLIAKSYAKPL